MPQRGLDRRRGRLAQPADRGIAHGLPDVPQQDELLVSRTHAGARCEPRQQLLLADAPHATGHALATRLVAEELGDAPQRVDEVDGLVEDHDHARAEGRCCSARRLERERHVQRIGPDEHARRTAEQDRPDVATAADTAGKLDEVAQRGPEFDLVDAGPLDVPGQAEELRPGRALGADARVGLPAHLEDERDVGQRLDVVDDRRLAEQTDLDRERRLVARLAALALDRLEERRFLATDVRAGATPDLDVERETRTEDVRPEQPGIARGSDRMANSGLRLRVLTTDVEVAEA